MISTQVTDSATLTLLGGWHMALVTQRPAEPDYEKGRALLAYLAIERQLHSREKLSELLWPGAAGGRANLRQILSNLRQVLGDRNAEPFLLVRRDTLRINPQGGLRVDVAEFAAALPSCAATDVGTDQASLARMAQVVALYRGELLAGFSLPDCPDFEDWLQIQREALHRRALALLEQLANGHEQREDFSKALHFALRYLELEPWDEAACRRVMRLYAVNGQYSAALAQFATCSRLLKQHLGVLPSEETQALAQRVRQGQWQQRKPRREVTPLPTAAAPHTERRQVTVLYCELSPIGVEDPDEAMDLLGAPQARCAEAIRQFSGHIVKHHGGGLLAYFGYPQAHEEAARRAVQAALALIGQTQPGLDIRVGVHTGLILTTGDASMPDMVGKTSRLAIQLRLAAARNAVAISGDTWRIAGGYFDCSAQDTRCVPGWDAALDVFTVHGESGARTRLEAASRLTPMAGRQTEMAQLMALWHKAAQGQSHTVLIQGEAGMGKSRLLHTLKSQLVGLPHAIRELRCFPEFSQSPFRPLIEMFEAIFGVQPSDTPTDKFGKLVRHLAGYDAATLQQDIPLLAKLLALPLAPPYQMPSLSSTQARQRTSAIVLELLQALAARQPTLLIVEDLHWIDPSTLDLLTLYVQQGGPGAVLTLFTARPEFVPPWPERFATTLALNPLDDHAVAAIVTAMDSGIPAATVGEIVRRADGVPLFAEEMAKAASLNKQASVPATLQDLLGARMDKLGEPRYLAQLAATLGREFELTLLRKISPVAPGELALGLIALQEAGLILAVTDTRYQFKHALIQEAAYQSQSRDDRQAAHRRIALALQNDLPEVAATRPELLARHFSNAGDTALAVAWWIKAGQRAALNSDNLESIGHFNAGLQLLPMLAADPQRDRTEFHLLAGLCPVLYATHGYGCEQARHFSLRLSALNAQAADAPKLFQAKWASMVSTIASTSSRGMPEAAAELLQMAGHDPLKQMAAHTLAALSSFWLGDFAAARQHDEQAIALYQPDQRHLLVGQFGSDLMVNCTSYLACSLYFLGDAQRAQQVCRQMLAQARALAHPHTLAQALSFAALLQRWLKQPEQALLLSAQAMAIARQHDFQLWRACGEMTHGWARVMQGQPDGLADIDASIATMRQALGGISIVFLSSRIEALVHLQQFEAALAGIDQALADAARTGDGHFLAELHRLQGVCLLEMGAPQAASTAQRCFEQALTISRQQHAKALEWRAATSLARLHLRHGQAAQARQALQATTQGFADDPASHDLTQALASLQELRA